MRYCQRLFARWHVSLEGFDEHFDGEPGVCWDYNRRRQQTLPDPFLPALGKAIDTRIGQAQPPLALDGISQPLKYLACAQCHGIILGTDQFNLSLDRSGEA